MMTVTLSVDHRVIDGALAAQFLRDLRDGLERPGRIIL
jgi:pyruvate dehydrogenase E2 component (dihydrolipoamide acetyltransferase)